MEYIRVLLGYLAIDALGINRTVSLVSSRLKQTKNLQVKQYIFTDCFISGTTNQQKFGGIEGYTLKKIFSTDLHKLEKQPKTKVGGNFPSCSPWRRHFSHR